MKPLAPVWLAALVVVLALLLCSQARAESALSPDGKSALLSRGSGDVKLRDLVTGRTVRVYKGHTGSVTALSFSPDGQTFLSGGEDGTVRLWSLSDGRMRWGVNLEGDPQYPTYPQYGNNVIYVAFMPDGESVFSVHHDGSIELLDGKSGKEVRAFRTAKDLSWSAKLSADGARAVTTSTDKNVWTIHVWDINAGEEVRKFNDTSTAIFAALLSDGKTLLSGGNHSLRLWDVASGRLIRTLLNPTLIDSIALSPDGKTALVGAAYKGGGVITVWDVQTGKIIRQLRGHRGQVGELSYSDNSATALSGADDGLLIVWDVPTGKILSKVKEQ